MNAILVTLLLIFPVLVKANCPVPKLAKPLVESAIKESIQASDPILTSRSKGAQIEITYFALNFSHITINQPAHQCTAPTQQKSYCEDDGAIANTAGCLAFACAGLNSYHSSMWRENAPFKYDSDLLPGVRVTYLTTPRIDVFHTFTGHQSFYASWSRDDRIRAVVARKEFDLSNSLIGNAKVENGVPNATIEIKFSRLADKPIRVVTSIGDKHQIHGSITHGGRSIAEFEYLNDFKILWSPGCR